MLALANLVLLLVAALAVLSRPGPPATALRLSADAGGALRVDGQVVAEAAPGELVARRMSAGPRVEVELDLDGAVPRPVVARALGLTQGAVGVRVRFLPDRAEGPTSATRQVGGRR
jgi:hypothetical protein